LVSIGIMSAQINVRLPDKLLESATKVAKENGYKNIQELIKEALREKISFDFRENNPHVR